MRFDAKVTIIEIPPPHQETIIVGRRGRTHRDESCRDARESLAGGRPFPLKPRTLESLTQWDAVTFDTTDAQIVRPYRTKWGDGDGCRDDVTSVVLGVYSSFL